MWEITEFFGKIFLARYDDSAVSPTASAYPEDQ
jgi:hypothetical protein